MENSAEIERAAAAWLARRDSVSWTERDEAELAVWLGSTAHRVAWLRLEAAWRQSDRLRALAAGMRAGQVPGRGAWTPSPFFQRHVDDAGELPTSRPADAATPRTSRIGGGAQRLLAIAATLALVVFASFLIYDSTTSVHESYATAVGEVRTITLRDGSRATLSSDSRIDVALSRSERHIDLQSGEAFFDVSKNPARPFVVSAGEHRVIAVGTHFAVREDTRGLRVVVTEGRVRLEPRAEAGGHPTVLSAGMVAIAGKDGLQVRSYAIERAEALLSWRTGLLSFRNTPLGEAVDEFNRYSVRKIRIATPALAAVPISGNFRWSNSDAFVRLLERGFDLHAERHDDEIVLSRESR